MPFGSYQVGPDQAVTTAVRFIKEGLAHAVKFEGGRAVLPQVRAVLDAGIPFMGHLGFTPQSEHKLGGYRVQGRGAAAQTLVDDALALEDAGAFAIVLEMVPAPTAAELTKRLSIPTIGIGAGSSVDGQVLVWTDFAGLTSWSPRFAKRYADLRTVLSDAARTYADDVRSRAFPSVEESFDS